MIQENMLADVIMINSGDTPNTATVYRLNENGVSELFPRPTISL